MSHNSSQHLERELCERLETIRLQRNVSQASLADEAGVSRRTISRMENGQGVSLNTFVRVARTLGLGDELRGLFQISDIQPIDRVRDQSPRKHASPARTKADEATPWEWAD